MRFSWLGLLDGNVGFSNSALSLSGMSEWHAGSVCSVLPAAGYARWSVFTTNRVGRDARSGVPGFQAARSSEKSVIIHTASRRHRFRATLRDRGKAAWKGRWKEKRLNRAVVNKVCALFISLPDVQDLSLVHTLSISQTFGQKLQQVQNSQPVA